MRFPVVLFDLDGTLVDSGAMILASFRHATLTVLAREIPDEALLARVGGSSLTEQMRAIDPARVDDLVASYRAHNEPLHDALQPCAGIVDVVERLRAEGRRLGIVTAKRQATVVLAFRVLPLAPADAASHQMLREQVDDVLESLGERERKVLELRFGLDTGRSRTLEEVGREFGVTRERIRQIEAKALRKLRHPSRSKKLKDYLE